MYYKQIAPWKSNYLKYFCRNSFHSSIIYFSSRFADASEPSVSNWIRVKHIIQLLSKIHALLPHIFLFIRLESKSGSIPDRREGKERINKLRAKNFFNEEPLFFRIIFSKIKIVKSSPLYYMVFTLRILGHSCKLVNR